MLPLPHGAARARCPCLWFSSERSAGCAGHIRRARAALLISSPSAQPHLTWRAHVRRKQMRRSARRTQPEVLLPATSTTSSAAPRCAIGRNKPDAS
eukprot:358302-Chlamydomonas_euryale.AAC.1